MDGGAGDGEQRGDIADFDEGRNGFFLTRVVLFVIIGLIFMDILTRL